MGAPNARARGLLGAGQARRPSRSPLHCRAAPPLSTKRDRWVGAPPQVEQVIEQARDELERAVESLAAAEAAGRAEGEGALIDGAGATSDESRALAAQVHRSLLEDTGNFWLSAWLRRQVERLEQADS